MGHGDLPKLTFTCRLGQQQKRLRQGVGDARNGTSTAQAQQEHQQHQFYDAKFCPFDTNDRASSCIVAIAGLQDVIIARVSSHNLHVLHHWQDDEALDGNESLNSLCWARDAAGNVYICVAGTAAKIKLVNVRTGKLERTLAGHGGPINDLTANPQRPQIIASASDDVSIRLWDLDVDVRQPCAAVLAEGHLRGVMSLAWHHSGLYLLSGGRDAAVCLWVMASLRIWPDRWYDGSEEPQDQDSAAHDPRRLNIREPHVIEHPHFRSTQMHTDVVDSLAFHGSLILSKAAEKGNNRIVLWRICGFEPNADTIYTPAQPLPPLPPRYSAMAPAASDEDETRSAFHAQDQLKLEQLLTFELSGADYFYMRFGISRGSHPVLAFANVHGVVAFWSLQRLSEAPSERNTADDSLDADIDNDPILGIDFAVSSAEGDSSRPPAENGTRSSSRLSASSKTRTLRTATTSTRAAGEETSSLAREESPRVATRETSRPARTEAPRLAKKDAPQSAARPEPAPKAAKVKKLVAAPFVPLKPHETRRIARPEAFAGRGVAWSWDAGSRWCLVVGDGGVMALFERATG